MKLTVHAAIFSIVFAGFVAGAVTTSPTKTLKGAHSTVISTRMPVPNCPPDTGCKPK
jgi:hypothetical protein